MKEFIETVLKHRNKYINENVPYRDLSKVRKKVLSTLNLNDMGELRDKYEGSAFLANFSLRIFGVIVLEKIIKTELIDWENLNPRDYKPVVNIGGKKIKIITSEYGDLPIIKKNNNKPAIINIKRQEKDVWICGFATPEILNKFQTDKGLTAVAARNPDSRAKFTGFGELKQFQSYEELMKLLND